MKLIRPQSTSLLIRGLKARLLSLDSEMSGFQLSTPNSHVADEVSLVKLKHVDSVNLIIPDLRWSRVLLNHSLSLLLSLFFLKYISYFYVFRCSVTIKSVKFFLMKVETRRLFKTGEINSLQMQ